MSAALETCLMVTRQSIVSRKREEKARMLRVALDPEGRPFVDVRGKAPGRGVYVEPEELREALSPKALGRAFRGEAKALAPAEVEAVEASARARLEAGILEILGLCRRAGGLAVGMDAAIEEIVRGRARVVVVAEDLSERSRERVAGAAKGLPIATVATVAEMGRALGREVVGVLAIGHASFAARVLEESERLERLRVTRGRTNERSTERSGTESRGKTTDG